MYGLGSHIAFSSRENVKYTVVENPFEQQVEHGKFMRCFSYNLHLMSNTEPEIIDN
ncbi:hypothetical protein AVEN_260015-1, partial [Araneus ventricosus]